MLIRTSLAFVILFLAFSIAGAEVYQWVDERGVMTFKDTPPPPSKNRRKVKIYSDDNFTAATPYQPVPQARKETKTALGPSSPMKKRFAGTVEIYVTEGCGYCEKAQNYLKTNGIPFVAYDIDKDKSAEQRHKTLGGKGVPLIIIGKNKMYGYNQIQLAEYINNSN